MPRVTHNANNLVEDNKTKEKPKCAIKKEVENPGDQVFHRKSERRRVARDIFLVFEEQPSRRRTSNGSNRKKAQPKAKFGHLNVENPIRTKGLLRDIKNEPKCYLNTTRVCKKRKQCKSSAEKSTTTPVDEPNSDPIARVKPIFLWVKQDDTRIVEVRCEDYDKRNRIRITKTSTGWRSIPRTDPSSSKIVKFFQKPSVSVKHEVLEYQKHEKPLIENIHHNTTNTTLDAIEEDATFDNITISSDNQSITETISAKETTPPPPPPPPLDNIIEKRKKKSKKEKSKRKLNANDGDDDDDTVANDLNEVNIEINIDSQASSSVVLLETETQNIDKLETYQDCSPELHLCPETGLFLPNASSASINQSPECMNFVKDGDVLSTVVSCVDDEVNKSHVNELVECLDEDTKNLKDLLDDADLLQHCADNINSSGVEMIDSLVKRSCENNFIQENDMLKDSIALNTFITSSDITSVKDIVSSETVPTILHSVNDACLSFNEAGEIEGLNGELFQAHNYIDTFEKSDISDIPIQNGKPSTTTTDDITVVDIALSEKDKDSDSVVLIEETPKDLSYKKREEICPPSESRSQCLVTSSSDIIKSPQRDDNSTIESSSETIKNIIIDQFVKLNSLNEINAVSAKQQSEPIDLGKHRNEIHNESPNYIPTTNYVETVVICDNSNDEPVKKRIRNTEKSVVVDVEANKSVMDGDPDPLTQLQLLIRNTAWKVPDPILVPKDRLGAVLASPAREIPLLITTRPELRLPEAFAYPEIIQNPNILVISMAQLEAILKNEMNSEKQKPYTSGGELNHDDTINVYPQNVNKSQQNEPKSSVQPKENNTKCSHVDNSLASDINAATLAVLNQMLWLPYFGQLSQEFFKSFKDSTGIQNKYNNLLPLFNQQFGLQHLDDLYKNYVKQISNSKNLTLDTLNNHQKMGGGGGGAYSNPLELTIFKKIVQQQMHNFLAMAPFSTTESSPPLDGIKHATKEANTNELLHMNAMELKSPSKISSAEEKPISNFTASGLTKTNLNNNHHHAHHSNSVEQSENTLCLNNIKMNCDDSTTESVELKKFAKIQKQVTEHKPRLTCKSLSNLLDPESITSSAFPVANFVSEQHIKDTPEHINKQLDNHSITKDSSRIVQASEYKFKAMQPNKVNSALNAYDLPKQRKRNIQLLDSVNAEPIRNAESLHTDTNPALWHPLFGSNAKSGYSSPWQWTTVTASGE